MIVRSICNLFIQDACTPIHVQFITSRDIVAILANNSALGQSVFLFIVCANGLRIFCPFFQLSFIRRLNQAPKTSALIMFIGLGCVNSTTIDPTIGLLVFNCIAQRRCSRSVSSCRNDARIGITVFSVRLHIVSIAVDGACLPLPGLGPISRICDDNTPVLGPGVLGCISDGDDALPLVV